jgi:hypothetical protein
MQPRVSGVRGRVLRLLEVKEVAVAVSRLGDAQKLEEH